MQDSGKKGEKVEKIPLEIEIIEKKSIEYSNTLLYSSTIRKVHINSKKHKNLLRDNRKKTMFRALASRAKKG